MKKKPKNKNSKAYIKWRTRVDYKNGLKNWSKQVQERDGNKCIVCGKTTHVQAHHVLDKKYYKEYSLDINVGVSLCVHHHKWSSHAAHTNPVWFVAWLEKNRPEQLKWCRERTGEHKVFYDTETPADKATGAPKQKYFNLEEQSSCAELASPSTCQDNPSPHQTNQSGTP